MEGQFCEIISQNNGKLQLIVNGFVFVKNKVSNKTHYWECERRVHKRNSESSCTSRATTVMLEDGQHELKKMTEHTHSAEPLKEQEKVQRYELRKKPKVLQSNSTKIELEGGSVGETVSIYCEPEVVAENVRLTMEGQICLTVPSQSGKLQLVVDGFLFTKNKVSNQTYYWECERRFHKKNGKGMENYCPSRATTVLLDDGKHELKKMTDHNHAAEPAKQVAKIVRHEIKRKSKELPGKPSQLVQDMRAEMDTLGIFNQSEMISDNAWRSLIKRARTSLKVLPREPTDLAELNIPDNLKKTISGFNFLVKEADVGEDKILIYTTAQNIRSLSSSSFWVADGTFRKIPNILFHFYVIYASIGIENSRLLPLVYVLMTSKNLECYERMMQDIKDFSEEQGILLRPNLIITDFDFGAISCFKKEFPLSIIKGSLYHLGQIIYRRILYYGLALKFSKNIEFHLKVCQILALAFLPADIIVNVFSELKVTLPSDLNQFVQWFEENFVFGRYRTINKDTRSYPLFEPTLWSIYENIVEMACAQLKLETWHKRWLNQLRGEHAGTYYLINEIIKEDQRVQAEIDEILAGKPAPPLKPQYVKKQDNIAKTLEDRGDKPALEVLCAIANNLSL